MVIAQASRRILKKPMNQHETTLRIGGVPEHFNLPWQLAAERDIFSNHHINMAWTVYAGGTGAMTKALKSGELDVAILLTEGFLAAADQGLKAKIAKVYIDSPLIWGIYSGSGSRLTELSHANSPKMAISRKGSGSHLMATIDAHQRGAAFNEDQWVIVNSLHGAMESLARNETQYFYWEKFMTRPFVQQGIVNLVGEFSAPWSSFLIVASEQALATKSDKIQTLLQVMNAECISFKQDNASPIYLGKRFDMSLAEARQWLRTTQWNYDYRVNIEYLNNARAALASSHLCAANLDLAKLCAPWVVLE
jgi:ABC-type nitrate/sulfonate/bicarbonate transport system substrate-binding protein